LGYLSRSVVYRGAYRYRKKDDILVSVMEMRVQVDDEIASNLSVAKLQEAADITLPNPEP
jgi:hypothetical protein